MKSRPWIWIILANVVFISGIITLVVIAVRHSPQQIPITQEAHAGHGL
jgi:hypothetical protein